MPRGTHLSEDEKISVMALHISGMAVNKICMQMNRSRKVIDSFLKNPEGYGKAKRTGRPSKLSDQDKRNLIREAKKTGKSSKQLKISMKLDVSDRYIRKLLSENEFLIYGPHKPVPKITRDHEKARLKWCNEKAQWNEEWDNVIFSDEKKFNLDGPDGLHSSWYDIRGEKKYFSKRKFGGGSVMIWAGFSKAGKTKIAFLEGNQTSSGYIYQLSEYLLPYAHLNYGTNFVFQQDLASIHNSKETKLWFQEQNINVLDWPACSPDLNPIENLWGIFVRKVYADFRQFSTKKELKKAILDCWESIESELLIKLINSMPRRCMEVILAKGKPTKY